MNNIRKTPAFLLTSLTLLVLPVGALAQPTPAREFAGSTYARIRHQEGFVTVSGRGGDRSGDELGVNAPVLAGQQVATAIGRLELQLADGSLARMGHGTVLGARTLSDAGNDQEQRNWMRLLAGAVYFHVEGLQSAQEVFRVDTPATSIHFLTEGVFRIDTRGVDGRTTISSHSGVAEVVAEGSSVLVRSGERADVSRGTRPSNPRPFNAFSQDEFDRWNRSRQAAYVKPYENLPARQVPRAVRPFVTELAYYGEWVSDPGHGWVWYPAEAPAGWSPYRHGRWEYGPAGWLWIADEPWGWAPYHYGRWQQTADDGWFWVPGSAFAGAWVSWAWGPGYLGWCPLDAYNHPAVYPTAPTTAAGIAWVVVPLERVHEPELHDVSVPLDRLQAGALHSLNGPPGDHPLRVAAAGQASTPPAGTWVVLLQDTGDRVSFRTLEGGGEYRERPDRRPAPDRRDRGVRRVQVSSDASREPAPGNAPSGRSVLIPGLGAAATVPAEGSYDDGRQPTRSRPAHPEAVQAPPAAAPEPEPLIRVIPVDDRRAILQRMFRAPGVVATPTTVLPTRGVVVPPTGAAEEVSAQRPAQRPTQPTEGKGKKKTATTTEAAKEKKEETPPPPEKKNDDGDP